MFRTFRLTSLSLLLVAMALPVVASPVQVTVTVENLAPEDGAYLTPVWTAFHAGDFDLFDPGVAASSELERLAEDGDQSTLMALFSSSSDGVQETLFGSGGPIAPGETTRLTMELDSENPDHRYFSYASMVIPSNDAFVANPSPMAHPVFDELGAVVGGSWIVYGRNVWDAGTEVNDEVPANTAFFGQMAPNTGMAEGGTIHPHGGFFAPGMGGVVDDPMFAEADFSAMGYRMAKVTLSVATTLEVSITNLAPMSGTYITPVWIGVHDGSFDAFDVGAPASSGLERVAEDGNTGPLSDEFAASGAGHFDTTIPGPNGPMAPGETTSATIEIDGTLPTSRYLSFVSMVVPSNDAFLGNDAPNAFPLFDAQGKPRLGSYVIYGNDVLDAGTEVNDEIPANTALFGQMAPDTGTTQGGVVAPHPGFLAPGSGGILDDPDFAAGHFNANGYPQALITVSDAGSPGIRLRDRFRVSAVATDFEGVEHRALGLAETDESGFLYFFERENVELLIKVIDGCGNNGHYWVFVSGLTNVEVDLVVEDLHARETYTVRNELGDDFEPVLDTQAFATCP